MSSDQIIVFIYILAWVIAFFVHTKKSRHFDAGSFIIASYVVYAFFSYILLGTDYSFLPLKVFPFIYLFVMLLIGMMPILRFRSAADIPIINPPITIINAFCLVFIISTLLHFPQSISNMAEGITKMVYDSSAGLELYNESMEVAEDSGHGISNLASIISNAFSQIGFFLTVYYLTLPKGKKWIAIALFLASFMKMAVGISMGQRGLIVEPLIVLIATFFMMRRYVLERYKKALWILGIIVIVIISVPVILLTISRFDNSYYGAEESTYYYLGHENLTFNNYALDDGGIRYGDRTIPFFKKLLGFQNVPNNFVERRAKYPNLKVNDEVFVTYVGDMAIDFGPSLAVVIILFFSVCFTRLTKAKNGCYQFHQLLLVHFVLYLCTIGGLKLFPYSDIGGNLKIIIFILSYSFFAISSSFKNSPTSNIS